ncbi:MAG: hypothetical protein HOP19_18480 [Acidobacteria bacterium]|nr:hypothetical protein [Acidobacteriota bacterium]
MQTQTSALANRHGLRALPTLKQRCTFADVPRLSAALVAECRTAEQGDETDAAELNRFMLAFVRVTDESDLFNPEIISVLGTVIYALDVAETLRQAGQTVAREEILSAVLSGIDATGKAE